MGRLRNIEQGIAQIPEKIQGKITSSLAPIQADLKYLTSRLQEVEKLTVRETVDSELGATKPSQKVFGYAYLYLLSQVQSPVINFKNELEKITEDEQKLPYLNEVEQSLDACRSELKTLLGEDSFLQNNVQLKVELDKVANPLEDTNSETVERHLAAIQKSLEDITANYCLALPSSELGNPED